MAPKLTAAFETKFVFENIRKKHHDHVKISVRCIRLTEFSKYVFPFIIHCSYKKSSRELI